MQPLSPPFFEKKRAAFQKNVFSIVHLRVCFFFCLFHISVDFRVLFGAPLAQNGPKKHQQMTHLDYFWSFLGPTRPTKHTHHNPTTPRMQTTTLARRNARKRYESAAPLVGENGVSNQELKT